MCVMVCGITLGSFALGRMRMCSAIALRAHTVRRNVILAPYFLDQLFGGISLLALIVSHTELNVQHRVDCIC